MPTPRLHALMREGSPQEVLDLLKTSEGVAMAKELDEITGRLALHAFFTTFFDQWKLMHSEDHGDIKMLLDDIFFNLLKRYPEGVKKKDKFGNLPIHYAAETSARYLNYLFEPFPESLQVKGSEQRLPIHNACLSPTSLSSKAIEFLLEKDSKTLREKESSGMLPIHLAAKNRNRKVCSPKVLQALTDNYVSGLQVKDKHDMLPIHWATVNENCAFEAFKIIADKYPDGLKHQGNRGFIPIHIYFRRCRHNISLGGSETDLLLYMLDKFPDSVKQPTPDGYLPLHFAVSEPFVHWGSVNLARPLIARMIELYPKGLLHKNKQGELPIDRCYSDDNLFLFLAKSCPSSLLHCSNYPLHPVLPYLRGNKLPKCRANIIEEVLKLFRDHVIKKDQRAECKKALEEVQQLQLRLDDQEKQHRKEKEQLQLNLEENEQQRRKLQLRLDEHEQQHRNVLEEKEQLQLRTEESEKQYSKALEEKQQMQVRMKEIEKQQKVETEATERSHEEEGMLEVYKKMAQEGRKVDQLFLLKVQDPKTEVSTEELKSFASSLNTRLELLQAMVSANTKPSMVQAMMFPMLITHHNPPRPSVLQCIESLHTELQILEDKLDEQQSAALVSTTVSTTDRTPGAGVESPMATAAAAGSISGDAVAMVSPAVNASDSPERQAKRARLSPAET